jgi:ribonuclease E
MDAADTDGQVPEAGSAGSPRRRAASRPAGPPAVGGGLLFQAPEFTEPAPRRDRPDDSDAERADASTSETTTDAADSSADGDDESGDGDQPRRRRRRGGRGRKKRAEDSATGDDGDNGSTDGGAKGERDRDDDADDREASAGEDESNDDAADDGDQSNGSRRRRRRRRRTGDREADDATQDDPPNTVVKVREPRDAEDEVASVKGSTRIEAKKQRRREGREAGRRRPPVVSESEFLARREAVDRVMAVRQNGERTQIGVLEDGVLVEHYVSRASEQPMIGNVYLGRVQNVLPAMEAAFIDIGRGRNAVLYAGEVDWKGLGHTDGPKKIEEVLKSGQSVLVQVTKEPVGHKGARLTGQISLPGRYVVYVPGGSMSGISRKLPENERNRLKKILKQVVPDDAGVIVRTAAEGATEEELTHDVSRLRSQWEDIQKKTSGNAPQMLHGEPDLAIKVVRDLFNEDFSKLVVSGDGAWETIEPYVSYVASSLRDRLEKWSGDGDIFAAYRIDEQIAKALERKVWLPSGGSLVIDRTEAMTVVDVNTGKFTGSGGNLEETVTKNNLEAAEEIVRQVRLRDIGGIIVVDFIDMVLETNRDLVLRRLVECLGRDRTKHQVAEVTSLGLVQMTRKRIGSGLLEVFSETCESCNGRGVHLHSEPIKASGKASGQADKSGRSERRGRRRKGQAEKSAEVTAESKLEASASPGQASPADLSPVNGQADKAAGKQVERPEETSVKQPVEQPRQSSAKHSDAASAGDVKDSGAPVEEPGAPVEEPAAPPTEKDAPAPVTETAPAPVTQTAAPEAADEVAPKRPARRPRRRAQRPAGSPDAERAVEAGAASGSADDLANV